MKKTEQVQGKQQLVDERLNRKWSQQEVADRIGTTPGNVSRWERGVTTPSPYFRQQLSTLFGKSPQELGLLPHCTDTPKEDTEQLDQVASQMYQSKDDKAQEQDEVPSSQKADVEISSGTGERQGPGQQPLAQPLHCFSLSRVSTRWGLVLICIVVLLTISLLLHVNSIFIDHTTLNTAAISSGPSLIPPEYGVQGTLFLNNALLNKQTSGSWFPGDADHPTLGCHIHDGGYLVIQVKSNYCLANHTSKLTNFVYQIEMKTLQEQAGQTAGIVFRVDDTLDHYYSFQVSSVDGSYTLYRSDPAPGPNPIIAKGYSSAIVQGNQQTNILAVKAIGGSLDLYINFQLVGHVADPFYQQGNIGVGIVVNENAGSKTEVTFRNARVWTV